jgi:hypothetical protein
MIFHLFDRCKKKTAHVLKNTAVCAKDFPDIPAIAATPASAANTIAFLIDS